MSYFSSCCYMQSSFCCSTSLALLAQEQSLCHDDLGAAVNSDIAFFFPLFYFFGELGKSDVCCEPQAILHPQKAWAQVARCALFRRMLGFAKAHAMSISCLPTDCHRTSAVVQQKHTPLAFNPHVRNAAQGQKMTAGDTHCMLTASLLGQCFCTSCSSLPHPVLSD